MSPLIRRVAAAASAVALAVTLAACTNQDSANQDYLNGTNSGYVGGEGTVVEIPEADRGEPVSYTGVDQDGNAIDGEALRGSASVINFWYAACGPCRVEAPYLEEVYLKYKDEGVSFVGVNTSDLADTAKSFMKDYDVTYPSIIDQKDGAAKIAFAQATPIQATPTTLVLDKQGRVAARIIGPVKSASILNTLVSDLQDENS